MRCDKRKNCENHQKKVMTAVLDFMVVITNGPRARAARWQPEMCPQAADLVVVVGVT